MKPVPPLAVKPDQTLPVCSQQSQIVREVRASIPPLPASCQRSQIVREVRVIIPLLPACSHRSQFHPYQRSQIHQYQPAPSEARLSERWEWAFWHYQLAPSKAKVSERWEWPCQSSETKHVKSSKVVSEAKSTPTCVLPASPEPLLPAMPDPPLLARPFSPLPAKPDPLHSASSQQSLCHP